MYYYGPMNGNGWNWGWGLFMVFFLLVFLAIVTIVVIRLLRGIDRAGYHSRNDEPLNIAKERYAKGEITKEQFEQLKKDLK